MSYIGLAATAEPTAAIRYLHSAMAIKFLPQAEENLNNIIRGFGYDPYNSNDRIRFAGMAMQQRDSTGELVELQQAALLDKGKNGPALFQLSEAYAQYGLPLEAVRTYKMAIDAAVDPEKVKARIKACDDNKNAPTQYPDHFFVNLRNSW